MEAAWQGRAGKKIEGIRRSESTKATTSIVNRRSPVACTYSFSKSQRENWPSGEVGVFESAPDPAESESSSEVEG